MQHTKQFILKSGGDEARAAQDALLAALEEREFDASCCFAVRLALEEALSNAFKHGNKNDPSKVVRLHYSVDSDSIEIQVEDEGEGFDPDAVPDPTEQENLEIPSGRGIVLMKSFMSEIAYEPPGNRVRMTFRRSDEVSAE